MPVFGTWRRGGMEVLGMEGGMGGGDVEVRDAEARDAEVRDVEGM
jgi:hypothetical protein